MSDLVASVSQHFIAGTDVVLEFTVTDGSDPVNLSGMDIAFAAGRDGTNVLSTEESSPTATVTVTDAVGGVFRIAADASDTEALSGTYRFLVQITDGQGVKNPVARGFLTFSENLLLPSAS